MFSETPQPLWALVPSLLAIPLILATARRPNLRETWTLLAALSQCAVVLSMLPWVLEGHVIESTLWSLAPDINLSLRVDPLGFLFALVASTLWIVTSCYSIGYVRGTREKHQTRYFASFACCLTATIGIAFSANLLTFLLFFELLTLTTYPLVIHKETKAALSAGRKYLAYTLPAGLTLFGAICWTATTAGNLDFVAGGFLSTKHGTAETLQLIFLLFMIGVGVKAGVMPLHSWLPSAMAAPTPVSALLHAVAVVKAGAFGVLRVTGYVFGPELLRDIGAWTALAWFAGITLTMASLLAIRQDNLKRRLAYSTIAHLSYTVLGAALLSPWSWTGASLHLVFHATLKITLFFCAGAIYVNTHIENISDMAGIGRRMPVTMAAFAVASLGLVGFPGINGFASKWSLALGSLEAGQGVFLGLLVLSGVLNASYFLPIIHAAFFKTNPAFDRVAEASPWLVAPLVITATISIVWGIAPNLGAHAVDLAMLIATSVTGEHSG
ncbi:MAG: cation:proton antiporter [Acidobacteria bacterium]|nr:cation:proton antiporter [Acidobacteriota bacterium]